MSSEPVRSYRWLPRSAAGSLTSVCIASGSPASSVDLTTSVSSRVLAMVQLARPFPRFGMSISKISVTSRQYSNVTGMVSHIATSASIPLRVWIRWQRIFSLCLGSDRYKEEHD